MQALAQAGEVERATSALHEALAAARGGAAVVQLRGKRAGDAEMIALARDLIDELRHVINAQDETA